MSHNPGGSGGPDPSARRDIKDDSERLSRALIQGLREAVMLQDRGGRVLQCNPAAERLLGVRVGQVLDPLELYARLDAVREDGSRFPPAMQPTVRTLLHGEPCRDVLMGLRRPDGRLSWLSVSAQPVFHSGRSEPSAVVTSFFEITERKLAEERLFHLAFHDALTGLPNRSRFMQHLDAALLHARDNLGLFGIALVDLGRFNRVNAAVGHSVGDRVLEEVAARLLSCLRKDDLVARLAGDEFALLLHGLQWQTQVTSFAERTLESLALPVEIDGLSISLDASIGIALHPSHGGDASSLLRSADRALQRAKEAGRRTYRLYSPEMSVSALERLKLEQQLRGAGERGELRLAYQPQIDLDSGRTVGVEALMRWCSPESGMVMPSTFIPIAEETGQMPELGAWALREACAQVAAWQRSGIPLEKVAVNVSAQQFERGDFVDTVCRVLSETGIDPCCLALELTETAVLADVEASARQLARLREVGVRVVLDDFGTGYSSLSYVHRLPLDGLKIDRSFVQELVDGSRTVPLVRAMLEIARSLDVEVIAEGVETPAQLEVLRDLKCGLAQGYLFSMPLDAHHIALRLAGNEVA